MASRFLGHSICWLAVPLLCGCSGSGTLTGKITLQGEPVAGADLLFESTDGESVHRFYGKTDSSGMMMVDYQDFGGLPQGKYQITVTRFVQPNGDPLPTGEEGETMKINGQALRQTIEFEKSIASGENAVDLELADGKFLQQ